MVFDVWGNVFVMWMRESHSRIVWVRKISSKVIAMLTAPWPHDSLALL